MSGIEAKYKFDPNTTEFIFQDNHEFQESVGWINHIKLGFFNQKPAVMIDTHYAYNTAKGIAGTLKRFEDKKITDKIEFLYPENYQDLTGKRNYAVMYVIADNKEDLSEALACFSSDVVESISEAIKHEFRDSKIRDWKLKAA